MHARALLSAVTVSLLACGSGRPDIDRFGGERESEDASADGASGLRDAAPGIRLLSDVVAPRETDGRGSGGAALRDAREVETERDVDSSRDGPFSDGPFGTAVDAGRDVAFDAGRDVAFDAGRGEAADANGDAFDACANACAPAANHLLLSEVVTRPSGAEMIEIVNPTHFEVPLSDYLLSDSHLYYRVASGTFANASGSDFAARFPEGFVLRPGGYVVVALGNASGGSTSFLAVYGQQPDFELRPTANGADDDPDVPNMQPAQTSSIGATATLTDGGEPIVLFAYRGGDLVSDADYLFFGAPSSSNPVVDKTGVIAGASSYQSDTPGSAQHLVQAPGDGGSLHRCLYAESEEKRASGNGVTGHDETSEDATKAFALGSEPSERTPGRPPPPSLCGP